MVLIDHFEARSASSFDYGAGKCQIFGELCQSTNKIWFHRAAWRDLICFNMIVVCVQSRFDLIHFHEHSSLPICLLACEQDHVAIAMTPWANDLTALSHFSTWWKGISSLMPSIPDISCSLGFMELDAISCCLLLICLKVVHSSLLTTVVKSGHSSYCSLYVSSN